MRSFDPQLLQDTIHSLVHALSNGEVEQLLAGSQRQRVSGQDMRLVIAEHGQQITLPLGKSKTYFTSSASPADAIHADIRLHVDVQPSDLVRRCTLFKELQHGRYAYTIDDILAP